MPTPDSIPDSYNEDSLFGIPCASELPMTALALMHQWSTRTCYGFGDQSMVEKEYWRDEVPVIAQQFPFLMRGILASSALHLGKGCTADHMRTGYLRIAAYHHALAIPEYRSHLCNLTKESAPAVMAFACMLTMYSFASPKYPGMLFAEGQPEWMYLHRGVHAIPMHWETWAEDAFIGRQISRNILPIVDPSINPDDWRLCDLERLVTSLPPEEVPHGPAYQAAIYWLRQAFAHTYIPESQLGPVYAVLFWIERVPQSYFDLLMLQRPRAMVFMAYVGALMKRSSNLWYVGEFPEHIVMEARNLLSPDLHSLIAWPMQVCGLA